MRAERMEKIMIEKVSKWAEIRNDFFNEEEQCVNIDGYLTDDDNEEGKVIAKIFIKKDNGIKAEVVYLDEDAKTDWNAQELIKDVVLCIENDGAYQD
jgi:hypothetical protein